MTKVPPQSEPQSDTSATWTRSDPVSDPIIQQDVNFDPRRAVTPDGARGPRSSADPAVTLSQSFYAPTQAPLQPIVDQAVDIEAEPVPLKRSSFLSRIKTRIDEEMPDNVVAARKPFLMGLLSGVVLMLLLGQIFRATQPDPTFATLVTPVDNSAPVAFLDQIPTAD